MLPVATKKRQNPQTSTWLATELFFIYMALNLLIDKYINFHFNFSKQGRENDILNIIHFASADYVSSS